MCVCGQFRPKPPDCNPAARGARDHGIIAMKRKSMEYQSYKNLPTIAGMCSMEDAAKPGLSVEEVVRRLKRYHYAFKRLFELLTARITAEPIYELKMAWSHHSYLCAEYVTALRT